MASKGKLRARSQSTPRRARSANLDVGDIAVGMLMARRVSRGARIGSSRVSREEVSRRLVRIARLLEELTLGATDHWRKPYAKWLREVANRVQEANPDTYRREEQPYHYEMGPFASRGESLGRARGPSVRVQNRRAALAAILRASDRTGERLKMPDMADQLTAMGHRGGAARTMKNVTAKDVKNDLAVLFPKRAGRRSPT